MFPLFLNREGYGPKWSLWILDIEEIVAGRGGIPKNMAWPGELLLPGFTPFCSRAGNTPQIF